MPSNRSPISEQDLDPTADLVGGHTTVKEDDLVGQVLNDRYRLDRELGRGGMAVVYQATEIESGKPVAIKTVQTRLTGSAKQRFTREFSTIASIKHPHCLDVYEYGESHLGPFFAMELFTGETARRLIGEPQGVVFKALAEVGEAIDYVHSRRIVHRDVKPGNILVQPLPNGDGFKVKLADFGLAKFANTSSSMSGDVDFIGTLAYSAPEQIMNEELDHRADLYSFGIVCYELLTGRHPFEEVRYGRNPRAIVIQHLKTAPPAPRELGVELPEAIEVEVMRLLEKDPGNRPQSVQQLRTSIARHLGWDVEGDHDSPPLPSQLRAAPFLSLQREQDRIDELLAESLNPSLESISRWAERVPSSALVITGDAGIGKSSLMRQAARSALVENASVYQGRCFDGNLSPYQPFVQIVKQLLLERKKYRRMADSSLVEDIHATTRMLGANESTAEVDSILENFTPEILSIGPELRSILPGQAITQADVAQESDYVFRAMATFFIELSKVRRICLMLEDLHWADQSTRSLLKQLASALDAARREASEEKTACPRLIILGTSRAGGEYAETDRFLHNMVRLHATELMELGAWSSDVVQCLIASLLGARPEEVGAVLVEQVQQLCFGNPFYISETLREWRLQEQLERSSDGWTLRSLDVDASTQLPVTVKESLRAKIEDLPALEGKMLAVSAVIGAVVDVDLLEEVISPGDSFEFFDALDDLLGRQILRDTGQAKRVEFTHDLWREITLQPLSETRRQGLHQTVGNLLERRLERGKSVPAAKLAEHFLAAGDHDKAFGYMLKAGEQAFETFAHNDVITTLEAAIEITPQGTTDSDLHKLYFLLAQSYSAIDQAEKSCRHFETANRYAEDLTSKGETYLGMAQTLLRAGDLDEAAKQGANALRCVGYWSPRSPLGRIIGINVSGTQFMLVPKMLTGRRDQAKDSVASQTLLAMCWINVNKSLTAYVHESARHATLAKFSDDPSVKALAYGKYGFNLGLSGLPWLGKHFGKLALHHASHAPSSIVLATAKLEAGGCYYFNGELDVAEELMLESLAVLEKSQDYMHRFALHMLRHVASARGNATSIVDIANNELQAGEAAGDDIVRAYGLYGLAHGLALQGNHEEAIACGQQSLEILAKRTKGMIPGIARQEIGRAQLLSGDYGKAAATLEEGVRNVFRNFSFFEFVGWSLPLLAEARLGPSWHEDGAKPLDRRAFGTASRAVWLTRFYPNVRSHAVRILGRSSFAKGKHRKARKCFESSMQLAEKVGARYDLARTLIDSSFAFPELEANRDRGLRILDELGCVLPVAEQEYLGLPHQADGS